MNFPVHERLPFIRHEDVVATGSRFLTVNQVVSQPGYGGWPIKPEGKGYSLYSYPTPQDGIEATVAFLIPTVYPRILAALKAGVGLSSSSLASELSVYSGGGYTEIPDTWGASQGRPKT